MALLRRLYGKLRLTVNETKSAVASVFGRKFLGYGFWPGPGGVIKRKVAEKPLRTFKQRIRQLTCRSGGRSMQGCGGSSLRPYIPRMEGVLPAGANTTGLARARPVAASSAARHPAQAVEARHDHVPGIAVLTLKWSDRLGLPRLS
jgi:RNA-directed DNA polymerase